MPLICGCDDNDDGDWFYDVPDDYIKMDYRPIKIEPPFGGQSIKTLRLRRQRCSSCKDFIEQGSVVTQFNRFRHTKAGVEEYIHGDYVTLAPMYLCERCSDLYFSFAEIGYGCIAPDENMVDLAAEYAAIARGQQDRLCAEKLKSV